MDHWILLRRNMARLKLEKFRRLAEPGQFLGDFVKFFSRCQDELVSSEDYQHFADELENDLQTERTLLDQDTYLERVENVALQKEIARAYKASEELLAEKKCFSFGSLITWTVELLRKDTTLRERFQQRYKHILVDEFQDTNIAQLELLLLLSPEPRNIVVVGDNDQAIYRFRGASFGSFKLFLERFAGWKTGRRFNPVSRHADGKLPLHAEYFARGDSRDRAKRSRRRFSEESPFADGPRRRTHSRRRIGRPGRRSRLGRQRVGAFTSRGNAVARFCGALPPARPSR